MLKISYAACPCLSQLISAQFTRNVYCSPKSPKKNPQNPHFGIQDYWIWCQLRAGLWTHNEQHTIIVFLLWSKRLNANQFTLRCTQYIDTSILQSQQHKFGVRKCYVGRNLHQILMCLDSSLQSFLHRAFRTKVCWQMGQIF